MNECTTSYNSTSPAILGVAPGKSLAAFEETARWMLLSEEAGGPTDGSPGSTDDGAQIIGNGLSARHLDTSNILFMDGHVKSFRPEKARGDWLFVGGLTGATACP